MKRRSFLSAMAGAVVAPCVAAKAQANVPANAPADLVEYIACNANVARTVDVDWYAIWQAGENDPVLAKIRYRVDGGKWKVKSGPIPLEFEMGCMLSGYAAGRKEIPTFTIDDSDDLRFL